MLDLKKYKQLGRKKETNSLSPGSPQNCGDLSQNLKQERELFCGCSPNSEIFFDAKPDQASNRNQYFNISRIRSDNNFKIQYELSSKEGQNTAEATNVGNSNQHSQPGSFFEKRDFKNQQDQKLQIGTINSDINFSRGLNIATDFDKIQFTPPADESFDLNEGCTFENQMARIHGSKFQRFNNASMKQGFSPVGSPVNVSWLLDENKSDGNFNKMSFQIGNKTPEGDADSGVYAQRISLFNQSAVPINKRLSLIDNQGKPEQYSDCPLSTARSCESLFNKVFLPENAGLQERNIHQFLDQINVNQINVKEYIESLQRIESPNVKKLFNQQQKQPNLKDRRKMMNQASTNQDGILSRLRLSNNHGGMTARSSPGIQSLTILTNNVSNGKSGNESQYRLRQLELSMKRVEEPMSQVSYCPPSMIANRSDQPMSDSDEEESNSTRKFTGGLKPDNFADQKFEREADQIMLTVPAKQRESSHSSRSSDYQTCEYYQSPDFKCRMQGSNPIQILQDSACLSPLIMKKQENDMLRSGRKPFNLGSSLKKVKREGDSQDKELIIISNLNEIHESSKIEEEQNILLSPPTIPEEENQTPQFSAHHISIQLKKGDPSRTSKLSLKRPKGLTTQWSLPDQFEEDTPVPKPQLSIQKEQMRTFFNEVFEYNKRQRHEDYEGSSHSSSSKGLFEVSQVPNATKKCDVDSLFDQQEMGPDYFNYCSSPELRTPNFIEKIKKDESQLK